MTLLIVCVMPFRVKAAEISHDRVVSSNTLESDAADSQEVEDEEVVAENGQSLLEDQELRDGIVAYINFSWKYTVINTLLLSMILAMIIVIGIFNHFVR